jgi:hypothetical protein
MTLVRTDIFQECSASIIRVTRISELGTTFAVTGNRCTLHSMPILVTLMMEVLCSTETSVVIRATWHNIPEGGIVECLPTVLTEKLYTF